MARGPHIYAVATATPQVGWCPSSASVLAEDEPTKKVPEHLIALAAAIEDTDVHTAPMCGVATSTLEALDALEANELTDAFESIDRLESDHPGPVHPSGVVRAGTTLPFAKREVIPPPPRRPQLHPPLSSAFAASLEAFTPSNIPFRAPADNEQGAMKPRRRSRPMTAAAWRVAISRSVASGILALMALLVLVIIGGPPLVILQPVAHVALTAHARAERSDPSGTARAPRSAAPRPTPLFVASALRAPAPARIATGTAGRIIRTSPF
jgi:hypothetical protein